MTRATRTLHLFAVLARISRSMNPVASYFMNTMESEASVIARGLRRRDPNLLDRLIEQYQHRLLRYLIHLSGNRELAEDLFQETWIRVMERGHQYDGRREFSTWLYAVARNLTIDYLRRKSPVSLDGLMDDEERAPLEPADTRPSAWELVAQSQETERINAALAGIPAECREAIVLRFQDGLALEEMAAVTGAPLGTVKSRLYRGLSMLMRPLKGSQA
jgi:RNA polymerase sigma-70 factor, ECF subfamily